MGASMPSEREMRSIEHIGQRCWQVGILLIALALVAILIASLLPISASSDSAYIPRHNQSDLLLPSDEDVKAMKAEMAGRRLVRPLQIRAAVRDTGAAAKLLERLKLCGIVQVGDERVAYIQIGNNGLATVRAGQNVSEFVVKSVNKSDVVLSLEGVEAVLQY